MENMGFGLQITLWGMGTVFLLLALLSGVLMILGRLDKQAEPVRVEKEELIESDVEEEEIALPALTMQTDGLDADTIAAITIAVLTHWEVRRKQAAPAMRSYWPGSQLFASRWVAAGRVHQNQSWRRR